MSPAPPLARVSQADVAPTVAPTSPPRPLPIARALRAPHLRSRLDDRRLMGAFALALLPCLVSALYQTGHLAQQALAGSPPVAAGWRGAWIALRSVDAGLASSLLHGAVYLLPLLAVTFAVGAAWERGFSALRGRAADHRGLGVMALLFTLSLPATLPPWQAALGFSFGIVIGKEIFGGFGRNVAHPVVVGLVFLHLAWPQDLSGDALWIAAPGVAQATPLSVAMQGGIAGLAEAGYGWTRTFLGAVPGALGHTSAAACALGALWLVATGAGSWRVMLGGLGGLTAAATIAQAVGSAPIATLPVHWHLVTGAVAFALAFLATDPVTAPLTNPARWLYGAAIGALFVTIRVANPAQREVAVLAVLMGNLLAPLLDQGVLRLHAARRSRHRA